MTTSTQIQNTFSDLVDDPDKRFQAFFAFYCDVKYDPSISIDKYIRSGKELYRMANVYFSEHDYLHAFVLYSRHIVLYLEKIKSHPQYATCNKQEMNTIIKQIRGDSLPRAEKLKHYIKDKFAQEAKEVEAARQNAASAIAGRASSAQHQHTEVNFDSLKAKYNDENEAELERLKLEAWQSERNAQPTAPSMSVPSSATSNGRPEVNRALKPFRNVLANTHNLRIVSLPAETSRKFLNLAEANTSRNIETCGILAGRLSQNKFVITHCIIPKQKGTSETCSTEQEHELFEIIDSQNLITLGWIHTHPSQTAFLSSVDLHTHFGYQVMIPEAIAIVCAPSYDEWEFYLLFFKSITIIF